MKTLFIFTFLFSLVSLATPPVADRIVGLVEVPGVFGSVDPEGPPGQEAAKVKPTKLFSSPDEKSAVVVTVTKREDIESKEHSYEESSAIVYKEEKGWHQIRAKNKLAWLRPADAGTFRSYETLIREGLSYLQEHWDRHLYAKAGDLKKFEKIPGTRTKQEDGTTAPEDFDVEILDAKRVNDELWFEVQLIEGRCGGEEKVGKKGWVPAYNSKNKNNLWYFSRGC